MLAQEKRLHLPKRNLVSDVSIDVKERECSVARPQKHISRAALQFVNISHEIPNSPSSYHYVSPEPLGPGSRLSGGGYLLTGAGLLTLSPPPNSKPPDYPGNLTASKRESHYYSCTSARGRESMVIVKKIELEILMNLDVSRLPESEKLTWRSRGRVLDFCAGFRGSMLSPGTDLSDYQTLPSPLTRRVLITSCECVECQAPNVKGGGRDDKLLGKRSGGDIVWEFWVKYLFRKWNSFTVVKELSSYNLFTPSENSLFDNSTLLMTGYKSSIKLSLSILLELRQFKHNPNQQTRVENPYQIFVSLCKGSVHNFSNKTSLSVSPKFSNFHTRVEMIPTQILCLVMRLPRSEHTHPVGNNASNLILGDEFRGY
uniref:Uncharacterized protein n=1 Tax=Timema tahoe TaxID=61484 RepID=A0A7R9IGZ1_9NEOP|nr:unnamed protein product [Timema tahoe]